MTVENKIDLTLMQDILAKYGKDKGALITILQGVQEIYGYLPREAMEEVSSFTGISPAKIMGVATFYAQFRLEPIGKNLIMLCQGTACHVNGSKKIFQSLSEHLGVDDGETSEDGLFTLENVACLGCCSLAPAMMINDKVYGNLTTKSAVKIVEDLRKQEVE